MSDTKAKDAQKLSRDARILILVDVSING